MRTLVSAVGQGWFDDWSRPTWMSIEFISAIRITLMVLLLVSAAVMVVCILLQEAKSSGLGAITGQGTDSYYSKNKGRSLEGVLKRLTIIFSILTISFTVLFFVTLQIFTAA